MRVYKVDGRRWDEARGGGAFGGSERQGPRDPLWSFGLFAVQSIPTNTPYVGPCGVGSIP